MPSKLDNMQQTSTWAQSKDAEAELVVSDAVCL